MKNLSLLLSLLLTMLGAPASACTLHVVFSDVGSPPWFMGDGETIPSPPGIALELADAAAAKMNCNIKWQRMPNRRVQLEMEGGRVDGMLMFSYSAERAAFAAYPMLDGQPDPALRLTALTYRVYVRDASKLGWDGKQFSNLDQPLGVNAGYSVGNELRKLGVPVEEAPGTEQNLRKLLEGRIAGYVMQDHSADAEIEQLNLKGIRKLATPFSTKDYYLPFSKRYFESNQANAQKFWKLLAEARKNQGKALTKKYAGLQ